MIFFSDNCEERWGRIKEAALMMGRIGAKPSCSNTSRDLTESCRLLLIFILFNLKFSCQPCFRGQKLHHRRSSPSQSIYRYSNIVKIASSHIWTTRQAASLYLMLRLWRLTLPPVSPQFRLRNVSK